MAYSRRLTRVARKVTYARQRRSRMNQVRMARAGYGASGRARISRVLSVAHQAGEIKTVDTVNTAPGGVSFGLNSGTSNIQYCNLIQSGSGFNNRVGRRIEMQSLHLTGFISQTATSTTTMDYVRIAVVYDRQANGAATTWNQVFLDYDQSSNTASTSLSSVNPDERERFMILADVRLQLPSTNHSTGITGATDGAFPSFEVNRFIKLRGLNTHYKADSSPAVIGDIATGALFVITQGSFASGSEGYLANLHWRLRYKDT